MGAGVDREGRSSPTGGSVSTPGAPPPVASDDRSVSEGGGTGAGSVTRRYRRVVSIVPRSPSLHAMLASAGTPAGGGVQLHAGGTAAPAAGRNNPVQ
jgi:hypothetical protein